MFVAWVGLRCVIVVFLEHTYLLLDSLELLLSPPNISNLSNLLNLEDQSNYLTLNIDLGVRHMKCCPVPSTSCDQCTCKV